MAWIGTNQGRPFERPRTMAWPIMCASLSGSGNRPFRTDCRASSAPRCQSMPAQAMWRPGAANRAGGARLKMPRRSSSPAVLSAAATSDRAVSRRVAMRTGRSSPRASALTSTNANPAMVIPPSSTAWMPLEGLRRRADEAEHGAAATPGGHLAPPLCVLRGQLGAALAGTCRVRTPDRPTDRG